jgi:hypothetical protein
LRALSELGQSGLLRIRHRRLSGEVHLRAGQVVGAVLGAEEGVAALEGIALVLPDGEFRFQEDAEPEWDGGDILLDDLPAYLNALAHERAYLTRMIPSLQLVPRLATYPLDGAQPGPVLVDRDTLRLMPAIGRGLSVEAMALHFGLVDTARALARLLEWDVAELEPGPSPIVDLRPAQAPVAELRLDAPRAAEL